MEFEQNVWMWQRQLPTEVLDSFGSAYTDWQELIIRHIVDGQDRKITPIVIDGLSADTKKTVAKQIAAALSKNPEINHFEKTVGRRLRHFRLGFGDVWRMANDIGFITSPPGSTTKEEYAKTAKLTLFLGTLCMTVLPRPSCFYHLSVSKTTTFDAARKIIGVDRSLSLTEYLAVQLGAFYADLVADDDLVELGLNQRMEMMTHPEETATIMKRDRLITDTTAKDQETELRCMGHRATRLQQEQTLREVAWWAIRQGRIPAISPDSYRGGIKQFHASLQGQDLINFIREHISPWHVKTIYQTPYIPDRVTFLTAHKLDGEIHLYNRTIERAIPALLREVGKPEFQVYKDALGALGIAV